MRFIDGIILAITLIAIFCLGVIIGARLEAGTYEGFWTKDVYGYSGDWVHINIDDMSFERALEVCRHEVGHEIFSEYCEQSDENFNECAGVISGGYGK
jgi:hypothetical protein